MKNIIKTIFNFLIFKRKLKIVPFEEAIKEAKWFNGLYISMFIHMETLYQETYGLNKKEWLIRKSVRLYPNETEFDALLSHYQEYYYSAQYYGYVTIKENKDGFIVSLTLKGLAALFLYKKWREKTATYT